MRVNKFLGAIVAASVAATPVMAIAEQPVGSVLTVNGDAFVSRQGRLVRAQPNMTVHAGDRLITRANGNASVGLNGCSLNVAASEMKTVGSSCGSVETASFDRAGSKAEAASSLRGGHGAGFIVAILAAIVVIVGIVIVVKNDDNPTSP